MATNRPSTTSSSSSTTPPPPQNQNVTQMTWYSCGQILPPGMFGDEFNRKALEEIKNTVPNLVPTTYEAAEAYLREELNKPKEDQYLRREMCMVMALRLPKDRKVCFSVSSIKSIVEIVEATIMVLPTVEVPPDSFGSPAKMGILDPKITGLVGENILLFDPPTKIPQEGFIVLSYLTRLGPDRPVDSSRFEGQGRQLDYVPYN